MDFTEQWESARTVFGWGVFGDDEDFDLVQVRGTHTGRLGRRRHEILVRSEGQLAFSEIMSLDNANLTVEVGLLRSGLEEVDSLSSGTKVAFVPGDDTLGVWRTNGAHAGIILDRIAAGELDPDNDLLRCLRGTPASEERLAGIDLASARTQAGRVPTEEEREARLSRWRQSEELRLLGLRAFEEGDEERGQALADELVRFHEETMRRHQEEFGS